MAALACSSCRVACAISANFGFLAPVVVLDNPTSTRTTRRILGWQPTHPGLLADFDHGDYFL